MRDNQWLLQVTKNLWRQHFADREIANHILVFFTRRNRRTLGSIKYDRRKHLTLIRVNGHFRKAKIPQYVVRATLAHEIVHYVHGFSSPKRQLYRHPHAGGVIRKEMSKRDLAVLEMRAKRWLKRNWPRILKSPF